MIDTIYIEKEIKKHPRTLEILSKFRNVRTIAIDRYGEVFNRKNQNFLYYVNADNMTFQYIWMYCKSRVSSDFI